jgi:hypothetical protein
MRPQMMPTKTFCTRRNAGSTSLTLSTPVKRRTVSGLSSVVTTSHDTRPASAEVPSDFSAMPSAMPTANSSAMLSSSEPPAAPRNVETTLGPAAELIQYEMPDRIAATGSTATGSMIDLPSLCRNFIVLLQGGQGWVVTMTLPSIGDRRQCHSIRK